MSAVEKLPQKRYTVEEYLALEEQATVRNEYHDGEILAMSGGSKRHSILCGLTFSFLRSIFKNRGCETFNDNMKLEIPAHNHFVYPDAMVVCGKKIDFDDGRPYILEPTIIVEVLSDSTEGYDRGEKFNKYKSIPSFREYILISQHKKQIEIFSKQSPNLWGMHVYRAGDTVQLPNMEASFQVDDLYEDLFD